MQNKEPQIYQTYIQCVTLQRVPSFSKGGAGVVCITNTFSSQDQGIQQHINKHPYHNA